jgi:endonuclease/exonuclease/phosphatase (EEP) superfamily protein YafD
MASVAMLRDLVAGHKDAMVIVAGDLNAQPDSRVIAEARTFLLDAFAAGSGAGLTYPADEPAKRIDYILYTPDSGLRCTRSEVIPEAVASDHRPVLARFTVDAE